MISRVIIINLLLISKNMFCTAIYIILIIENKQMLLF